MQREVGRNDCGRGHKCTQERYCSRLTRRAKAVNVHDFLALHEGGICFCWVHFLLGVIFRSYGVLLRSYGVKELSLALLVRS